MASVEDVLSRYNELCSYCDSFWIRAVKKNPAFFRCKEGCCTCCELESVTLVEAFNISLLTRRVPVSRSSPNIPGYCVFLENCKCMIYSHRPLICRTHGLLLKNGDHSCIRTCPGSDPDPGCRHNSDVLDWESLTMNLAKINMAFCIVTGCRDLASERIFLADIRSGNLIWE